jgi:hypothetical protein
MNFAELPWLIAIADIQQIPIAGQITAGLVRRTQRRSNAIRPVAACGCLVY